MRDKQTITVVTVMTAVLMFPITLTGASIALPDIRIALHGDLAAVQWVVNAYNTTFAGFMLAAGGLADVIGRRRMFQLGTLIFAVGGLLSAVAPNLLVLDVLRGVSGIGAAAAATSALALVSGFEGKARTRAFSVFGTVVGFGLAFGPSLASLLLTSLGWRSVFWLPALVGVAALALSPMLEESRNENARRVDWWGTVTFTGGLLLIIAGFVEGPASGWSSPVVLAAFVLGVSLLVAFVVVERRVAEPMFDFDLLRTPKFVASALAAGSFVMVLVPLLVYLPSYLVAVMGRSPREAGATLILLTAPVLVLPLVSGALSRRVAPNSLVGTALVLMGAGSALLTTIAPDSTTWSLAGPLLLIGAGMGLSTGLVDNMGLSAVDPNRAGTAAGMFGTSRLAFETVAIGIVGSIVASGTRGTLAGDGYTGALRLTLWLMAALILGVTVLFVALTRRAAAAQVPALTAA